MTRQFVALIPEQVRAHGMAAAMVLAHLTYLTRRQPVGVVATVQDLAAGTGQSVRTTHRAIARLRAHGLITSERAEPWNPTQRWQVVDAPGPDGHGGQDVTATMASPLTATTAASSVPLEDLEVDTAPVAPTEQGTLPFLVLVPDRPDDPAADQRDQGPPKTAQTLVARWVDGYRTVNGGADPHTAVIKPVAGQARNLAKACGEDHDAWVDAWHATYNAGVAGSRDLVRYLVPQQQRRQATGRAGSNAFAASAFGGPSPEWVDQFSQALTGGTPPALGSGS